MRYAIYDEDLGYLKENKSWLPTDKDFVKDIYKAYLYKSNLGAKKYLMESNGRIPNAIVVEVSISKGKEIFNSQDLLEDILSWMRLSPNEVDELTEAEFRKFKKARAYCHYNRIDISKINNEK